MFEKITKNTMSDCGQLINRDYKDGSGDIKVVCQCYTGFDVEKTKEEAIENSQFIAYCFELQQKYDISLFEESIHLLEKIHAFTCFNNTPSIEDIRGIKNSINDFLIKLEKQNK